MRTIDFVFAVHNHQPAGNFHDVIEEAFQRCYSPFLKILAKHPALRFTQHYSGILLEWLLKHHPEFIREMRMLVRRGQLELLTGAYYEAILAVIPEEDRIGQIRKLTEMITDVFGFRPRGMWLAERVWEPHIVISLVSAGVEFVMLDEAHFRSAGVGEDQLHGYYRTEDGGHSIAVLPVNKMLRYTIPFRQIDETKHYVQGIAADHPGGIIVHADDGEKFGSWPKTYDSVYGEQWLDRFCTFLTGSTAWLRTVHCGSVIDTTPPRGIVYFPTASYPEMMKWALPSADSFRLERFEQHLKQAHFESELAMFVRGGFWRNFLAKYPEANHLHKRMLRVAAAVHGMPAGARERDEALDLLWAAQCNDAYWHGVFGGIYLPNLRFPLFQSLLKAEQKADAVNDGRGLTVEEGDFDCDGADEIIMESRLLNLYLKPSTGGHLVELDYRPLCVNLLDIISRREEGYHRKLIAGGNVEGSESAGREREEARPELWFDWYRRASLVDHFLGDPSSLETFRTCRYHELGDFVNQPFVGTVRQGRESVEIELEREGGVWIGEERRPVILQKKLTYADGESGYSVEYRVRNGGTEPIDLWFGIEFNVGLLAGDASDRYYDIDGRTIEDRTLRSTGEEEDVTRFRLVDEWMGLETLFTADLPCTLWRCPIETVSLSVAGLERVYQSSTLLLHWKFRLDRAFSVVVGQTIRSLRNHQDERGDAGTPRRAAKAVRRAPGRRTRK